MKSLWEIREGDEILIKTHNGAYFTRVTKVTMNQIHTHSFRFYTKDGKPATRQSQGMEICQDPVLIKQMTDKREREKREREAREAAIRGT